MMGAALEARPRPRCARSPSNRGVVRYAEGSCMVTFGETKVLCAASLEGARRRGCCAAPAKEAGSRPENTPCSPRATHERTRREVNAGKPSGRTPGDPAPDSARSLRAWSTCTPSARKADHGWIATSIQADGGTRTAAITGAWVGAARLLQVDDGALDHLREPAARPTSRGVLRHPSAHAGDRPSTTPRIPPPETDANFVITGTGGMRRGAGHRPREASPSPRRRNSSRCLRLAQAGTKSLVELQKSGHRLRERQMHHRRLEGPAIIATHNQGKLREDARAARALRRRGDLGGGARPARAGRDLATCSPRTPR